MRKVDPLKLLLLPLIPALGFGIVEVASRINPKSPEAHVSVEPQISFTHEISEPLVLVPDLPPTPAAEPCINCAMDT